MTGRLRTEIQAVVAELRVSFERARKETALP